MLDIRRCFRWFRESKSLADHLAPMRFVSDGVFLTKPGEYASVLRLGGFDHETVDPQRVRMHSEAFGSALTNSFDERFLIYQYILKSNRPALSQQAHYEDSPEFLLLNRRAEFMESRRDDLYSIDLYLVALYRPGAIAKIASGLSAEKHVEDMEQRHVDSIDTLSDAVYSFTNKISDLMPASRLSSNEVFTFLRRLVVLDRERADAVSNVDRTDDIAWRMGNEEIQIKSKHLEIGDNYVKTVALHTAPLITRANILSDLLLIDCNFVACSQWEPRSSFKMRREIMALKKNFDASLLALGTAVASALSENQTRTQERLEDKSATRHIDTLDEALIEIENNGRTYGLFSLTIAFYGDTLGKVRRACAESERIFGRSGGDLMHERLNLFNSYLSLIPGNHYFNLRKLYVNDLNYSDLSFIWSQQQGNPRNEHLHGECLGIYETNTKLPYYFNLHVRDLCGAMLTGQTGAGKTFLGQSILAGMMKYRPKILILDIAGSYRGFVEQVGGAYYRISAHDQSLTINPFCLDATQDNYQFLFAFIKMMIQNEDQYEFSDKDDTDLYKAVLGTYRLSPQMRRLSNLVLPPHLQRRLRRWTQGGQYGSFFDNANDTLSLADVTCVEFHQLDDKYVEVLNLMQFYLMQRWDAVLFDPEVLGTFKLLMTDEGWRFALRTNLADYFIAKTKTNRAQNAGFLFLTHSPLDTDRAGIARLLNEACPMQILMYNPDISIEDYKSHFRLSDTEIEKIMRLKPKQQFLARTASGSVILNHFVDDETRLLFSTDPDSKILKRQRAAAVGAGGC